ncbi:uncharacterized protein E5676_scaffold265G00640 [Cucumis melo var. makuwa]|uniref:Uncharacterized protein n=1 Tax=Cucumis melo var. makuwa TaxID=1194695 RepID=A0A5D3C7K5_CUCMM|nr:uncharacterized protein E5676_scaffold265G00640 [Cucumis melo var. makuwa]
MAETNSTLQPPSFCVPKGSSLTTNTTPTPSSVIAIFVDGTLPCPIDAQRSSRIICNNIITALILNFVLKEIATNICFMDSTQELWLDIQQRYRRKN